LVIAGKRIPVHSICIGHVRYNGNEQDQDNNKEPEHDFDDLIHKLPHGAGSLAGNLRFLLPCFPASRSLFQDTVEKVLD
jgi:hypothetical protein